MEKIDARVLVSELLDDSAIAMLQEACEVDIKYKLPRQELLDIMPNYQGLVIRSETIVDEELLEHAPNLKIVGRAGSGLDNVDIEAATRKGVIVANTPESNLVSAAEHTMGLLLSSSRNIPWASNFIKSGQWDRKRFQGSELYGKTLGIIGLGRIGGLVSHRAKGFQMRVIAYDPYILDSRFELLGVDKKETLEDLLAEADFITIHTPKTEETFNMIGDREIGLMKQGVRVVNCARGGLYNEEAMCRGLESGKIASFGLDVWIHEPQESHPLYEFDCVVGTPHLGASTLEAARRVGEEVVMEVIAGLRDEIVKNAVNIPSVSEDTYGRLKVFIDLVERMGSLYSQLRHESVEKVEIEFAGQEIQEPDDAKLLSVVALKGILSGVLGKGAVNFVNAGLIAKQRGIEVKESISNVPGDYRDLIRVTVTEEGKGEYEIAGTVLEGRLPLIVKLGPYDVVFQPEGRLVYTPHKNVPGVIGRLGAAMGEYNVNISKMVVGDGPDDSITILNVDNNVPKEAIDRCLEIPEIYDVEVVTL
jgi:D-3-phosphoglycerate dehydrogenase